MRRAHGQIRRSQIITTYGPGALIDLPRHSAIVGGLDSWPPKLEEIVEPRLSRKLEIMTGVRHPRLFAPPPDESGPNQPLRGIVAWRFPEWFVVQEKPGGHAREHSRRLVHRTQLDNRSRFDKCSVVATRFVRACPMGHVDDLDWRGFVHGPEHRECRRQLWLDEQGTTGDLRDLSVRCECGAWRSLAEAADRGDASDQDSNAPTYVLGACRGARPWLGRHTNEECGKPSRLLIRTASNAYFAQIVGVLSLPDRADSLADVVQELWGNLQAVQDIGDLKLMRRIPEVSAKLGAFSDDEVFAAIQAVTGPAVPEKPVKLIELDSILAAPEGYGDDVPIDPDFHARRLPDNAWRHTDVTKNIEAVVQLHRLREVMALAGFTRLEAEMPDIYGEYESGVEQAQIALEPKWFPAVENRGEGVFLLLRPDAVASWLERPAVKQRIDALTAGHARWTQGRKSTREFPGGPYILLHTLSHLLLQSVAMRCGYPASSIRERIYADPEGNRYGLLLYTGCSDSEGTLGGLVQRAVHIEEHLAEAIRSSALCSNDPICAQHEPGRSMEQRWLHGAACHGCALVSETSCEMRNDYLDRALVVPVLGLTGAAFFEGR